MDNRSLYPIFLKLEEKKCLVVGGGRVAERKTRSLLAAGANVKLVAKKTTTALSRLARERKIRLLKKYFVPSHLKDVSLVLCATDDKKLNSRVAREARRRGILVNVADSPELCDFFLPAALRRGHFQIAVSTAGGSPAIAKRVRDELARRYGKEYGELTGLMRSMRLKVIREIPEERRTAVLNAMIAPRIVRLLRRGQKVAARRLMKGTIAKAKSNGCA